MLRTVFLVLVSLLLTVPLCSQGRLQLSDWQTYSSLQTVRSVSVDSKNRVWCGTTGGLFVIDLLDGEVTTYRNINALLNLDVSMVRCDPATQSVWVGCEDGSLAIATEDGVFTQITEIRRATQYQRRGLSDCLFIDDGVFFATAFGIVQYNRRTGVFTETIDRIGQLQRNVPVNAISVFNGRLWAATDSGMVSAPLSVTSLRQPSAWTHYSTNDGVPSGSARAATVINGQLYCAVGSRLLRFEDNVFTTVSEATTTILTIASVDGDPTFATAEGVFSLDGRRIIAAPVPLAGHAALSGDVADVIMYTPDLGIARGKNGTFESIEVNSPRIRQFMSLAVDGKGRLWSGSYNDGPRTGFGISVFDGTSWYNAANDLAPSVRLVAAYRMSSLPDGSIVVGTWGSGAYVFSDLPGKGLPREISPANSPIIGIGADTNFVLVGDAARDRNGTLWLVNEQALDRAIVGIGTNASVALRNCFDVRSNLFRSMAIDNGGTKWLGSPFGSGLLAYNERGTFDNSADDICQRVTSTNSNLPDNAVSAIRTDNNGALWIGTARGVAVITSPGSVTASTVPFVRRISVLGAVVVNDIAVDAINQKWIATPDGVFVLNEDGTEVIATLSTTNSPLVSNNVRSIVVDPQTGRVWFGTTEGLSSAQSQSIRPLSTYDVRCYPQPFRAGNGLLTIDGLASDTDVRIVTSNGQLVAALQTKGRQALWDGKDANGSVVPPGVYLVHVASSSDQGSAVAKVAVTR